MLKLFFNMMINFRYKPKVRDCLNCNKLLKVKVYIIYDGIHVHLTLFKLPIDIQEYLA